MMRLGVAASIVWIVIAGWLASRDETWRAAWRLHCHLTADTSCTGTTVFLVVHWPVIAACLFGPVVLGRLVGGLVTLRRGISRSDT
ncbi:hypothetical protein [Bradyrhizobium sp. NP1]|uniref:hypothetical protein n=1 Tax=Bradyrhizobium sp. NP1 TaxID=3049772 RepID=UPI0025A526D2|nr:hypothetical protein [Bradyrhizobium sp. NP1]WJR79463.1 hypothetical protein QOU61_06710 [Bradyrhizobium sp. NP1]